MNFSDLLLLSNYLDECVNNYTCFRIVELRGEFVEEVHSYAMYSNNQWVLNINSMIQLFTLKWLNLCSEV